MSYHISSIFCLHHITLIFSRFMISNTAPHISGAHIWVKYSKNTSNSLHFNTFFNKNDLKTKGSFLFINTSIPFVFYPNLLIYTKTHSFAKTFLCQQIFVILSPLFVMNFSLHLHRNCRRSRPLWCICCHVATFRWQSIGPILLPTLKKSWKDESNIGDCRYGSIKRDCKE